MSAVKHSKEFKNFLQLVKSTPTKRKRRQLISKKKKEVLLRLELGLAPRVGPDELEDTATPWGAVVEGLLRGDPWGLISMRAGVSLEYIRFVRDEAGLGKEAMLLGRLAGEIHGVEE